ncbi:hypothetical protein [Streptomyces scabiei]|uniref:hypothetical protein n=1 Tax=Streptomyces scabiei TaxID=1930 RepID=UPI0029B78D88|nr:hypothetical protein [Streptomyces scabiei]MDX3522048.1 hypothetical protein [Streptomyces scabiei]
MAAVSLETDELESLVEASLNNPKVRMALLNALRVKNGKAAYPDNFGPGDVNNIHDSEWRAALTGVQADLEA